MTAEYKDFSSLNIRVGTVLRAKVFDKAHVPAYQLQIDFGSEIGVKASSAQITDLYGIEDLKGKQVVAIVNFPIKQISNFFSEALVLGVYTKDGVTLLRPDRPCIEGEKIG